MRICVWGINYAPELTGIAPFSRALCEYLAERGNRVEVVTAFAYYPEWRKRASDQRRIFRTEEHNGVRIHRCWLYVPRRLSVIRRMIHEASFVAASLVRVLTQPAPEIFVVVSPPLLLGVAAWIAGGIMRVPFVFHVQDLQPDAAVGLGMLRRGWLTRVLYWMEAFIYSRARRVSGISRGMIEMFRKKKVSESKTIFFPNGVRLPVVLPSRGNFRARHGIPADAFVALYSGNLGVKQGLDILLEAARLLQLEDRKIPIIKVVIAGDGTRREYLEDLVRKLALGNVILLPLQPEEAYREMLADADCTVITQQEGTGSFFFPSKLLTSLAVAKPVISVADESSELAKACAMGGFGVNIQPNHADALAAAIAAFAENGNDSRVGNSQYAESAVMTSKSEDPGSFATMGQAGLRFAKQFELDSLLAAFEQELIKIANEASGKGADTEGREIRPAAIGSRPE